MDGNSGSGVKRKIPGPASKTVKKRNCNFEAELRNLKTECLFCFNPVLIMNNLSVQDTEKRAKLLSNLCEHVMKENESEMPTEFTQQLFPFCGSCMKLVEQLWEYDEIIRATQLKIAETMDTIEKLVVDGEVLTLKLGNRKSDTTASSPSPSSLKQKRFLKIRDIIFDSYRNKLVMKQKEQQKLFKENIKQLAGSYGISTKNTTKEHDAAIFETLKAKVAEENIVDLTEEEIENKLDNDDDSSMLVDSGDVQFEPSEKPTDNSSTSIQSSPEAPTNTVEQIEDEVENGCDNDDLFNTTSVIPRGEASSNTYPSLVDTTVSSYSSMEATDQPLFLPASESSCRENRKQEGVLTDGLIKIFWTSDSRQDLAYLDCSICTHEIRFPTTEVNGLSSAYKTMQEHIKIEHQKEKNEIYSAAKIFPSVYSCGACGVCFKDALVKDRHEVVHRTCDICGKVLGRQGLYNKFNMLQHKQTHKSEEEKKATVKAGKKSEKTALSMHKNRKSGKPSNYSF